jgi:2-(1,2-epoxy-1,2-dihydrophenyl)acetyl-CoA isomerase
MTRATKIDTGTDDLLLRVEERVATLTMNRPDRRNALSAPMMEGFRRALPILAGDPDVGCVVLTGAGRAFCAGGDVKSMDDEKSTAAAETAGGAAPSIEHGIQRLLDDELATSAALHEMLKPTLAVLPGPAAGAGLSMALACDLRIAAESAIITTAFTRVGFSGDFGGAWFLTKLIGTARARELYFLADRVDAKEMERLGIVNRVVPDVALEQEARALARRLANGPPVAYRYMKQNLNRALVVDLRTNLADEAAGMVRTGLTEDNREAIRAFVEKRDPVFRGR